MSRCPQRHTWRTRGVARALAVTCTAGTLAAIWVGPALAAASPDGEGCFLSDINSARAGAGLPALAVNPALVPIAEGWAQTMATAGSIFHNLNIGSVAPSNWTFLGENVGMGPDCPSIATAFMNSPEHKANILDVNYTTVGVGVVMAASGTMFVTEDFMGTGSSTPVPAHTAAPPPPSSPPAPSVKPSTPVTKPATTEPNPSTPAPAHATTAPVHTTPAPAHTETPTPAAPPTTPAPTVPTPAASPAPQPVAVEPIVDPVSAAPVVDQPQVVLQSVPSPASTVPSGSGGHRGHKGGLLHRLVHSVGSFFSHVF